MIEWWNAKNSGLALDALNFGLQLYHLLTMWLLSQLQFPHL